MEIGWDPWGTLPHFLPQQIVLESPGSLAPNWPSAASDTHRGNAREMSGDPLAELALQVAGDLGDRQRRRVLVESLGCRGSEGGHGGCFDWLEARLP